MSQSAPAVPVGYSPTFLPIAIPLPRTASVDRVVELDYPHFSIVFRLDRRLAAATAVNVDGAQLLDLARGDDWHFDARVAESDQAGPDIYARNELDRGHLVRRRDPVWGTPEIAGAANKATFAFTNAAPQAAQFNQGPQLWSGLEDHILEYAGAKMTVRATPFVDGVREHAGPFAGCQLTSAFGRLDRHRHLAASFMALHRAHHFDRPLALNAVRAREPCRSARLPN